jgi:hypothetical protein
MELYLHLPPTCEFDLLFLGFEQSAVYSYLYLFSEKLKRELELK